MPDFQIEEIHRIEQAICKAKASHEGGLQSFALQIAARCWMDPETQSKEMDAELATAFAKRLYAIMGEQARSNGDAKPPEIPVNVRHVIELELLRQKMKYPGSAHSEAEWILLVEAILYKVKSAWHRGVREDYLREMRQIAATAIACLIQAESKLGG